MMDGLATVVHFFSMPLSVLSTDVWVERRQPSCHVTSSEQPTCHLDRDCTSSTSLIVLRCRLSTIIGGSSLCSSRAGASGRNSLQSCMMTAPSLATFQKRYLENVYLTPTCIVLDIKKFFLCHFWSFSSIPHDFIFRPRLSGSRWI